MAVSGYVDLEHRAKATAAGFTHFLAKPYAFVTLQELMDRVAELVGLSRHQTETARRVADQTRQLNQSKRRELDDFWRDRQLP